MKRTFLVLGGLAGTGTALLGSYLLVRARLHQWGASDQEVQQTLPGDEIIAQPSLNFTLAITIDAPIDAVWPWIVQLGQGRGGWYSYDWLENLMGLDIHTADRILPEFQRLKPGDVIPTGAIDIPVIAVEPPRLLLLGGAPFATLAFVLEPVDEQRTRLVFRNRAALDWTPAGIFWRILLDPGIFVMSRKMLLVLQQRSESAWKQGKSADVSSPNERVTGSRRVKLLAPVQRFNNRILNPAVLTFAGQRNLPYSIVCHTGRCSGRAYRTPVVAVPIAHGFVIPLPYGQDVDWCRNVLAADGCTIEHDGVRYTVAAPHIVDADEALTSISRFRRLVSRAFGLKRFLLVEHVVPDVEQPEMERELVAA